MKKSSLHRIIWAALITTAVGIGIIIFLILDKGDVGTSAVLSYMTSPVIIPIIGEFLVVVFLVLSFVLPKQRKKTRRRLRYTSLILAVSLTAFYFYIPRIPIDIAANHPDASWNSGKLVHILPGVNSESILLKTSFVEGIEAPVLRYETAKYSGRKRESTVRKAPGVKGSTAGRMTDSKGTNWSFYVTGLEPDSSYRLELFDGGGQALCDAWEIRTLPFPESRPDKLRILVFTCPGGHDATRTWFGFGQIPLYIRQKLLNKALEYDPDIMVSLGDQIYYDIRHGVSAKVMGDSRRARHLNGDFDEDLPVLGTRNEEVLKNAVGPQIAYLYGTACRSLPGFFILDDHDYFVNDDAREKDEWQMQLLLAWLNPFVEKCVTLPPEGFFLELARTAQNLYLPEFLPDPTRPADLPGSGATDRSPGVNETYGSLRYGDLLEAAFFELRRFITLDGDDAVFLPRETEEWIDGRMEAESARYFVGFSALSFGWSCGKWLSWYPDIKAKTDAGVSLSSDGEKFLWQEGWFQQHNRILSSAAAMQKSVPLFVCGDIHHQSAGWIRKSDGLDLSHPIASLHPGALSVDKGGYPSKGIRGIKASPSSLLEVEEELPSFEKAGFVIMDVDRERITARFFAWRNGEDPVEAIDSLEPHFVFEVPARL